MRILTSYISRSFLVAFGFTLLIFLFIMAIGNIFRVIDLFSRGVSGLFILKVFTYGMPFSLIFAVPMSVLAASYLVFSRLASDREIIAMRACGISVWRIIEPPVIISILLSLLSAYITCDLAPASHFARRSLLGALETDLPLDLLDAGRFNHEFPGLNIYYVRTNDSSEVRNIHVNEFATNGVLRVIRAQRGTIAFVTNEARLIKIDLYDVRIDQYDKDHPGDPSRIKRVTAGHYPMNLDLSTLFKTGAIAKKRADLTMFELAAALRHGRHVLPDADKDDPGVHRTSLLVELHTRVVLALSCYAFALLGTALGIRIHRKESSVGIAITLIMVFVFYFFIIMADSLVTRPNLYPYLLVWVPFVFSEVAGLILIQRAR